MNSTRPHPLPGQEVFNWLHRLDLSHHFDRFLSSGVTDLFTCRSLSETQLINLGVSDIHERLTLLQAIRLLHANPNGTPKRGGNKEVELQLGQSRVLFYNNNPFPMNLDSADYSECADFDLRCYCEGGTGPCSHSDPEPFYESVGTSSGQQASKSNLLSGGESNNSKLQWLQFQKSFKSQLREQIVQDGINFSRIPDESTLRAVAAKYAVEFSGSLTTPNHYGLNGGGASFSSTSTASSSSSGYPSSLTGPPSSSSSAGSGHVHNHNHTQGHTHWLREGLPLLQFQEQVLQQLREIWIEERRKLLSMGKSVPNISSAASNSASPCPGASGQGSGSRSTQNLLEGCGAGRRFGGSGNGKGQNFTPGVYQPSSCLRDRDDIYDYIPPKKVDLEDDGEEELPGPSSRLRGTTLSRLNRTKREYNYLQPLGSRKGTGRYATLRGGRGPGSANYVSNIHQPSLSSYTISGGNSEFPHYPYPRCSEGDESVGCRTLVNLHKLGRRLGLTRFFRTLRIQNPDGSGETTRRQYLSNAGCHGHGQSADRVLYGITPTSAETIARLRRLQNQPKYGMNLSNLGFQDDNTLSCSGGEDENSKDGTPTSPTLTSSLPSNERIIETINRLKFEELQRRKERISQEHQMILKGLKNQSIYVESGSKSGTSDYFEDEIGEGKEGDSGQNYEEPFDSMKQNGNQGNQSQSDPLGNEEKPGTRNSRTSNESFSEIFARHLKSRTSNGSGSGASGSNRAFNTASLREKKEASISEDFSRRSSSRTFSSACNSNGANTPQAEDLRSNNPFRPDFNERPPQTHSPFTGQRSNSNGSDSVPLGRQDDSETSPKDDSLPQGISEGQALALMDSQPNPYDPHALRFKKGDIIQVIRRGRNSSPWIGRVGDQVGNFSPSSSSLRFLSPEKFHQHPDLLINLREDAADPSGKEDSPGSSHSSPTRRPKSVADMLARIGLENHTSLFIHHGFETLDLFRELEEEDLDRLGILHQEERRKLLSCVHLLREIALEEELNYYSSISSSRTTPLPPVKPKNHPLEPDEEEENEDGVGRECRGGSFGSEGGERPPAQTIYQYQYYQSTGRPSSAKGLSPDRDGESSPDCLTTTAVQIHTQDPLSQNGKKSLKGPSSTSLARFHCQPRDSGIFVSGKEEDPDSEELILSPVNLQQKARPFPVQSSPLAGRRASPLTKPKPLPKSNSTEGQGPGVRNGGSSKFLQAKALFDSPNGKVQNNQQVYNCLVKVGEKSESNKQECSSIVPSLSPSYQKYLDIVDPSRRKTVSSLCSFYTPKRKNKLQDYNYFNTHLHRRGGGSYSPLRSLSFDLVFLLFLSHEGRESVLPLIVWVRVKVILE